jgi:hypothetical protein
MLTNESFTLIKNIKDKYSDINVKELKELFNLLKKHKYNYKKPIINNVDKLFISGGSKYIPDILYKKIREHTKCKEIIWIVKSKKNIHCKLNIFYKNKISDEMINNLIGAISFIMSLSNRNLDVTLNIVLLKDKKLFNKNFTPNEINSGMADFSNNTIHIWRKEEIIKVIIHECIHILEFSKLTDTNKIINHYNTRYDINCHMMNINESYTEIWAKLLNCYYTSNMMNSNKKEQFDLFVFFIQIEKEFSLIQSYKIREFIKKNKKININKETNVVAYFLILSEILQNIDKFLTSFNFYLTDNNKFIHYLLNLPKPEEKYYTNLNKNLNKTFRMTAVEIKI